MFELLCLLVSRSTGCHHADKNNFLQVDSSRSRVVMTPSWQVLTGGIISGGHYLQCVRICTLCLGDHLIRFERFVRQGIPTSDFRWCPIVSEAVFPFYQCSQLWSKFPRQATPCRKVALLLPTVQFLLIDNPNPNIVSVRKKKPEYHS